MVYDNLDRRGSREATQSSIVDGVLAARGAIYALKADGSVRNVYRNVQAIRFTDPEAPINSQSGRALLKPAPNLEPALRFHSTA